LLRLHKHRFAGVLGISKNSGIAFRDAQLFFNTMNQRTKRYFHQYWQLYAMLLLPLLYFIIFKYVPIFGNVLAFRRYRPGLGAFGTEWVGLLSNEHHRQAAQQQQNANTLHAPQKLVVCWSLHGVAE